MTIRHGPRALLLALAFAVAGACSEDVESGGACPALCPGQELQLLDTVLTPAIVLDTSFRGYPLTGFEPTLLLAARGDSLDVRAVIRFDTLAREFALPGQEALNPVTHIDSATLQFRLRRGRLPVPATFTIDAYEVTDLALPDSVPTNLLPYFEASRFLGTITIDSTGFTDTTLVRLPLDSMKVREAVGDSARVLRIGLRISSASPVEMRIYPTSSTLPPRLRYRVHPDTAVQAFNVAPTSSTPSSPLFVSTDLLDYSIIAVAPDVRRATTFAIGGLPGSRSYLRFELPTWLLDSSTVLRARLELVQDPIRGIDDTTHVGVHAHLGLAGHVVTDLRKATLLHAPAGRDTMLLAPGDSGIVHLEINRYLPFWRTNEGVRPLPNALILRSSEEGESAFAARFFGLGAAEELRPRLRISYVRNSSLDYGKP
jgi:hypothetical protein